MSRIVPSQVVSFIDEVFTPLLQANPGTREVRLHAETVRHIFALVELLDRIPGELITLGGSEFARFIWGAAALKMAVKTFEAQPANTPPLRGGQAFEGLHPVDAVRQALVQCPDQFPAPGTAELLFVQDQDLRESLRVDISSTNAALTDGQWKAATVLAGSVVEALLLWKLGQDAGCSVQTAQKLAQAKTLSKDPGANLEYWRLSDYIEVAADLNFIKDDTAKLCRLTKDFRNLIHPGRVQRSGQECDRGTALAAAAAMERVIHEFA